MLALRRAWHGSFSHYVCSVFTCVAPVVACIEVTPFTVQLILNCRTAALFSTRQGVYLQCRMHLACDDSGHHHTSHASCRTTTQAGMPAYKKSATLCRNARRCLTRSALMTASHNIFTSSLLVKLDVLQTFRSASWCSPTPFLKPIETSPLHIRCARPIISNTSP